MIYARKDRYGMLWQFRQGDGEELIQAWEYALAKHGAGKFTGKIFGKPPTIAGVEEDPSLPEGCWLVELKEGTGSS